MLGRANLAPRHKNRGRPLDKDAPRFLQWVRGRNCIIADKHECEGRIEAAHVDYAGGKGMGTKVADRFTVPACSAGHAEQHRIGWTAFESKYRVNALALANQFWAAWPGRVSWENSRGE